MNLSRALWILIGLGLFVRPGAPAAEDASGTSEPLKYYQDRKPSVPWSINVVRVPRRGGKFEVHSAHGAGRALGLGTVSDQVAHLDPALGRPVAAVNGDFYVRQGAFTGDPRGLQILEGELISAPSPSDIVFWLDAAGEPHLGPVESGLQVIGPDGTSAPIGLNEERRPDALVLFTPSAAKTTRNRGGGELILERAAEGPWLPLRPGVTNHARIAQVRTTGNSPLTAQTMVLSIGPSIAAKFTEWTAGKELQISTATKPDLIGARTAISGGPILVKGGKAQRVRMPDNDSFQSRSAYERHPRSAVGWNEDYFFLVEVDGRQPGLSIGMTLQELGTYLVKLGCTEGMNLDGGGSATLWYNGQVRNEPCDGQERPVANALVVVQKPLRPAEGTVDEKDAGIGLVPTGGERVK